MASRTQGPESWQRVRLGDVAALGAGKAPRYENDNGNIDVLGANGRIGLTDSSNFSRGIAIGRVGASGSVHRVHDPVWLSDNVLSVKPCSGTCDLSFLYYVLTRAHLPELASKTAQPLLTQTDLGTVRLLLPPLPEQRAIAAVLDAIDEAIERTEAVVVATERLRDALLHELLPRGVPGWHTAWKEAPGIGTIPASWEVVRLGEVAEVASAQADPGERRFQLDLFVAPDDIEPGTGRLISRRTVADAAAISGKYEFSKGDVLYSKIRPYLMKVYIPIESGLCSADIYPLRTIGVLAPSYLAAVLLTPQFTAYTRTCSDRTGIPKINRVDLFKYSLPLPPLAEQRTIAAVLDSVDDAIARGRSETDVLRALKSSTADALLTGRVRVGVD